MKKVGVGEIKNAQGGLDAFSNILSIYVLNDSYSTLYATSQY